MFVVRNYVHATCRLRSRVYTIAFVEILGSNELSEKRVSVVMRFLICVGCHAWICSNRAFLFYFFFFFSFLSYFVLVGTRFFCRDSSSEIDSVFTKFENSYNKSIWFIFKTSSKIIYLFHRSNESLIFILILYIRFVFECRLNFIFQYVSLMKKLINN